jgi:hypothetical protein
VTCLKCRAPIPAEQSTAPAGEAGPEAAGPRTYHVERFQPTRGGSPVGVFVALGLGLVAALVLGAIASVVRQFFWLVLVFPALLGAAVGFCAGAGGWLAKCRRPEMIAGAGVVCGLASAVVLHYVRYLSLTANLPPGQVTFTQFLELMCRAGVMGFGYTASVIYYIVEVVVIGGAAGAVAIVLLDRPFCEACGTWKSKDVLGKFRINGPMAAAAVSTGQPAALAAPAEGDETVTLELFRCPHCSDGPIDVRATCEKKEGDNTASLVVFVTYPGAAADDIKAAARACRN